MNQNTRIIVKSFALEIEPGWEVISFFDSDEVEVDKMIG